MKIKLAILEKDKNYLYRIVTALGAKYAEKFEIYSYTVPETALAELDPNKIDVLLASDSFEINTAALPKRCAFAYFIDSAGMDTLNGHKAIGKFQKAEMIYKQILSVFAEVATLGDAKDASNGKLIVFSSPAGGVGCSTVAAACAMHYASQGKKTLYLNLEKYGSADLFFRGQGQMDMSDIVYAIKSKKGNTRMKLESCVKQDNSGVCFYSAPKIALDMLELSAEDIQQLLKELVGYDYIIADMDFSLSKDTLSIWRQATAVVMVGDGSVNSNLKTERAYGALATMESNADLPLTRRVSFIYNRVSSRTGVALNVKDLRILDGAPRIAGATAEQLLQQIRGDLASKGVFDKIIQF